MRTTVDLLAQYAEYHRDRRNIATHFVGVPMIVFAVGVLLAHPSLDLDGLSLTPAWIVYAMAALWFLTRGNLVLGLAVSASTGVLMLAAHQVATGSLASWLGWGVGTLLMGSLIQFIGHCYEGRKPAFIGDFFWLLAGPMFVTAEALFAAGWGRDLSAEIERRAGETLAIEGARAEDQ